MTAKIKTAACIGGGVIGGGWVARFALHAVLMSGFSIQTLRSNVR